MVLKRMIYKFPWYIFDLLLLYPLGHGRDHLEYTPFHPSIVCANFGWNWPSGPREDICQYIFYIKLSYPFRKTGSFIYFIHNLVKIGIAVLERNFFLFSSCIFAILLLSPLGKRCGTLFEQTWIPFIQGRFAPSLVKNGPVGLEKKIWKFRQSMFAFLLLSLFWKC